MLEKLFTSKNRIRILNFFLFEKSESHLREISRELEISISAIKREVDNLISIGILTKNKRNIILNKKCSYLGDLKNLFIKTDAVVYPIQEALKNKKIQYAFIFGSFARGEYKEDSDVDLTVIGDIKLSEIYKTLKPVEDKIKRDINPVIWTLKEFEKEKMNRFAKEIFANKFILIKGGEDEFRKTIRR